MSKIDQNKPQSVQHLVEFAQRRMFSVHRGAIAVHGRTFIFGNDGYGEDPCSKREVELLREALSGKQIQETAFTTDTEESYTWGMLVEGDHEDWVNENLWSFWNQAWIEDGSESAELEFVESVQRPGAFEEIELNRTKVASMMARPK